MKRKKGGENEEMENKETMKKDKKKRKKIQAPSTIPSRPRTTKRPSTAPPPAWDKWESHPER